MHLVSVEEGFGLLFLGWETASYVVACRYCAHWIDDLSWDI